MLSQQAHVELLLGHGGLRRHLPDPRHCRAARRRAASGAEGGGFDGHRAQQRQSALLAHATCPGINLLTHKAFSLHPI